MRKFICGMLVISCFVRPQKVKADAWGADIPILLDILVQNINQLYQMYELVRQTQESIGLMRDIHSGITQAIATVNRLQSLPNAGLYGNWNGVNDALSKLKQIYGAIPTSDNSTIQRHSDQMIAEAINMNGELFRYADDLETIGSQIQQLGGSSSPKGAAQLTAQGMGVMLRAMNQSMRAQGSNLKLQAQALAVENKREKDETRSVMKTTGAIAVGLKRHRTNFQTPRF